MYFPINTIILILIFAAITALQVFFSKKENKWLGLILPAIFFVYSLLMVLSSSFDDMSGWEFLACWHPLLLSNIPTLILLGIYFAYRGKIKRNDS